ncbi:restriction endonuclease [Nocardia albiluteola]|uniref:restriction endonuclease n=1 Tax=Nocardia albiluteola TaxID=2842303 RepID=UPI0027E13141|nr:restriction endonuclease [Nocardia albiluteola]
MVGGAGDLGADVIARAPDGRRIMLQAKRYRNDRSVGSQDVSGSSIRYDLGNEHPLVGRDTPDFRLEDGTRLGDQARGPQRWPRSSPRPWGHAGSAGLCRFRWRGRRAESAASPELRPDRRHRWPYQLLNDKRFQ